MFDINNVKTFFSDNLTKVSTDTLNWLAVLFIHCATVPSLLALLFGASDRLPSVDVVLFIWTGLFLMFIRSLIVKDTLNSITIGVGFMIQAGLLGFLVFK